MQVVLWIFFSLLLFCLAAFTWLLFLLLFFACLIFFVGVTFYFYSCCFLAVDCWVGFDLEI
ncbi:hypothetical protein BZA77DRAFT_323053 [Pyronema omphalodes]|nr:hypothetical protein BZA77DRAFT_323053 [Pyronema omphalodes]